MLDKSQNLLIDYSNFIQNPAGDDESIPSDKRELLQENHHYKVNDKLINQYTIDSHKFSNYHFVKKNYINIDPKTITSPILESNQSKLRQNNKFQLRKNSPIKRNFIYYDDILLKLNDGFQFNLIPRYCRLTEKAFEYFKDEVSAFKQFQRPLFVIPLNYIDEVRVLNFIPSIDNEHLFFEIVSNKLSNLNRKIEGAKSFYFPNFENQDNKSNNLPELNKKAIKNIFKRSFHVNDYHMMREVRPGFDEISKGLDLNLLVKQKSSELYRGILFKSKEEIRDFKLFKKKNKNIVINPKVINLKEEKKICNNKIASYNWTYREIGWYQGEMKFIFAVYNSHDLKKWISLFNWILSKRE